MSKRIAVTAIAIVVSVGLGLGAVAYAQRRELSLRAQLRGLNEVPPTTSAGAGELRATLSADETSIAFTLTFANLTGAPGAAHIHFAPTKVNGGVMVFFCGGGGKPACPTENAGTVTGTLTAADIVGPAAQGIPAAPAGQFADVVRAIKTGNAYANIHTTQFPGGEIRGQLFAIGLPLAASD